MVGLSPSVATTCLFLAQAEARNADDNMEENAEDDDIED